MSVFSAHMSVAYPPVATINAVRGRKSPHSLAREVMFRFFDTEVVVLDLAMGD